MQNKSVILNSYRFKDKWVSQVLNSPDGAVKFGYSELLGPYLSLEEAMLQAEQKAETLLPDLTNDSIIEDIQIIVNVTYKQNDDISN